MILLIFDLEWSLYQSYKNPPSVTYKEVEKYLLPAPDLQLQVEAYREAFQHFDWTKSGTIPVKVGRYSFCSMAPEAFLVEHKNYS